MLLPKAILFSSVWSNSLYKYIIIYLAILRLMDTWVVPTLVLAIVSLNWKLLLGITLSVVIGLHLHEIWEVEMKAEGVTE